MSTSCLPDQASDLKRVINMISLLKDKLLIGYLVEPIEETKFLNGPINSFLNQNHPAT